MVILTEKIVEIIEDLELKTGEDLEELKFKILNGMINYEKEEERIFNYENLDLDRIIIKVNGKTILKKAKTIVYNKKNKTYNFVFIDGSTRVEKFKDITIDLNLTISEIFNLFNL